MLIAKDAILRTYIPTFLGSYERCTTTLLNSLQQCLVAFPLTRHSRGVKALSERHNSCGLGDDRFTIIGEIFFCTYRCDTNLIFGECSKTGNRVRISCDIQRGPYSRRICCRLVLETPVLLVAISRPSYRQRAAGSRTVYYVEIRRFQAIRGLLDHYIIYVDVVISTCNGGLAVERQKNRSTGIIAQVNRLNFFSCHSDIVVHIGRTGIIPLTQNSPVSTLINRSQNDKTVVLL